MGRALLLVRWALGPSWGRNNHGAWATLSANSFAELLQICLRTSDPMMLVLLS